jgi:osmotically-inducible protein OsmY
MHASRPEQSGNKSLGIQIRQAFDKSPYSALRRIRYELREGDLVLIGEVPTHFMKQIASSCAAKVARDYRIVNQIRVVDPDRGIVRDRELC